MGTVVQLRFSERELGWSCHCMRLPSTPLHYLRRMNRRPICRAQTLHVNFCTLDIFHLHYETKQTLLLEPHTLSQVRSYSLEISMTTDRQITLEQAVWSEELPHVGCSPLTWLIFYSKPGLAAAADFAMAVLCRRWRTRVQRSWAVMVTRGNRVWESYMLTVGVGPILEARYASLGFTKRRLWPTWTQISKRPNPSGFFCFTHRVCCCVIAHVKETGTR